MSGERTVRRSQPDVPSGVLVEGIARRPPEAADDHAVVRARLYFHEDDEPSVDRYDDMIVRSAGTAHRIRIDSDTLLHARRRELTVARARTQLPELAGAIAGRDDATRFSVTCTAIRDGDAIAVAGELVDGVVLADAVGVGPRARRELDRLRAFGDRRWTIAAGAFAAAGAVQIGAVTSWGTPALWFAAYLGAGLGLCLLAVAALAWWYGARTPAFRGATVVFAIVAINVLACACWVVAAPALLPVVALWFQVASAHDTLALCRLRDGPTRTGTLTRYTTAALTAALAEREIEIAIDEPRGNVGMVGATLPLENWVNRGAVMVEDVQRDTIVLIVPPGRAVDVRAWIRRRTLVVVALWLVAAAAVFDLTRQVVG
jgi:hypothetical protein